MIALNYYVGRDGRHSQFPSFHDPHLSGSCTRAAW